MEEQSPRRPSDLKFLIALNFVAAALLALVGMIVISEGRAAKVWLPVAPVLSLSHIFCAAGLLRLQAYGRRVQIALAVFYPIAFVVLTMRDITTLIMDSIPIVLAFLLCFQTFRFLFRPDIRLVFESGDISRAQDKRCITGSLYVAVAAIWIFLAGSGAFEHLVFHMAWKKQEITLSRMETMAHAIEDFRAQNNNACPRDLRELRSTLDSYAPNDPLGDGWGRSFLYSSDGNTYTLMSYGEDGRPDSETKMGETYFTTNDIILANGAFIKYPDRWPNQIKLPRK